MAELELDILISRVLDGRAGPADWAELERLAARDPSVWRELVMMQRDERAIRAAMAMELARAEQVALPIDEESHASTLSRRTRTFATWAGWAAAACVGLVLMTQRAEQTGAHLAGSSRGTATANLISPVPPIETAADKLAEYLAKGREEGTVIREVPEKWLISAEPSSDGQRQHVIYFRLIMERTELPEMYTFSQDEWGNPAPARIQVVTPGAATRTAPKVPPV